MKVYRHKPGGSRFYVLMLFSVVLLALNIIILPGREELPVKIFTILFTLGWLAVTLDSLAVKIVVDQQGIGAFSPMCKKFAPWRDIVEVKLGHRWILGTFMPEHIIICYKNEPGKENLAITLHNDVGNWQELLRDITANAPSRAISEEVKAKMYQDG